MIVDGRTTGWTLAALLLSPLPVLVPTANAAPAPEAAPASMPAPTRIGAFVTSLSDIQESQRRFDITMWVWMLSPASIGSVDPARTLEITNAATVERQYAVTTDTAAGRYSQVKFRASVRAPLDFTHFRSTAISCACSSRTPSATCGPPSSCPTRRRTGARRWRSPRTSTRRTGRSARSS